MLKAILVALLSPPWGPAARQPLPAPPQTAQTQAPEYTSSVAAQEVDLAELRPRRILLVMAMREEAEPVIQRLDLHETRSTLDPRDPMRVFEGRLGRRKLVLILNGKGPREPYLNLTGPVAAAMTTSQAIRAFSPDLVINAGTAGGFGSRGLQVGDVALSRAIVFHDRHSPFGGAREAYALGRYSQPRTERAATELGLKTAVVATGNSFVNVSTTDLSVIRRVDASVVEMEAAAVAEVCAIYKVKMVALKAVTDDVEHPSVAQFSDNLRLASSNLADKLRELLIYLQRP